jgi:very-short-patch-repair endonuclease
VSQVVAYVSKKYGTFYVGQEVNAWRIDGKAFVNTENGRTCIPLTCTRCGEHYPARRVDNFISAHSNGCTKCSRGIKKMTQSTWEYKAEKDISELNTNNLTGNHIGKTYGDLVIVKLARVDKFGHTFYTCHCGNCNNTEDIEISRLTYGNRTRCSKCENHSSVGETAIAQYLEANNIPFKAQYTFEDLMGNVQRLRFDFAITKNNKLYLIEFQGAQHYTPVDFFGGEQQFALQQEYDNRKRQYCLEHGYELIEIPYADIKNIEKYLNQFKNV